jgi:integrase-like protein
MVTWCVQRQDFLKVSTAHKVWTSEYRGLTEARENIGRYLEEYNYDRPHRGVENRTPHEAFALMPRISRQFDV